MQNATPELVIRPRLVTPVLLTVLGWTIIAEVFLLTMEYALPEYGAWAQDPGVRGFIAGAIILAGLTQYVHMRRTVYAVYSDRIEYRESFLTETVTSTPMRKITNITMRRDWLLDRIFNTGMITFFTVGQEHGVEMPYVHAPKETYAHLLEIQNRTPPAAPPREVDVLKDD